MLLVTLYTLVLLWAFANIGKLILGFTYWQEESQRLGLASLIGLVAMAALVQIWHLLAPISDGLRVAMGGLSLGCFGWLHFRERRSLAQWWPQLSGGGWLLIGLLSITIIGKGASFSEIFDEGAYHLPIILLAQKYPLIPGVAHVHSHFCLETAWHELHSLVIVQSDWVGRVRVNPVLLLAMGLFVAESLPRKWREMDVIQGFLVLSVGFAFRNILTSAGNDLAAIYLAISGLVVLLRWHQLSAPKTGQWIVPVLLLIGSLICKVSHLAIGLLVLGLFVHLIRLKQWGSAWQMGVVVLCLMGPFLIRNVILSGYWLIPVKATALPVDWALPEFRIRVISNPGHYGLPESIDKASLSYAMHWWDGYQGVEKMIFVTLPIAIIGWVVASLKGRFTGSSHWLTRAIWAVMPIAGITIWYFTVPEFRYGLGIVLPIWVLGCWHGVEMLRLPKSRLALALALVGMGLIAVGAAKTWRDLSAPTIPLTQVSWLSLPQIPKVLTQPHEGQNFAYRFPMSYQEDLHTLPYPTPVYFWATDFPVGLDSSYLKNVSQRGPSVTDGYQYQLAD